MCCIINCGEILQLIQVEIEHCALAKPQENEKSARDLKEVAV